MESMVTIGNGKSITFCSGSNTIREVPSNKLICTQRGACGVWVVDADGGIDVNTVLMVSMALHCDGVKFRTGNGVIDGIADTYRNYSISVDAK